MAGKRKIVRRTPAGEITVDRRYDAMAFATRLAEAERPGVPCSTASELVADAKVILAFLTGGDK